MPGLFSRTTCHRIKRMINYLLFSLMAVFMIYTATMYYLSVHLTTKSNDSFLEQDKFTIEMKLAASDTNYYNLLSEESLLKARSAMIAHDSPCISIDLKNKIMMIELQGIQLHKTDISNIRLDRSLSNSNGFSWIRKLSYPVNIDSSISSISKITFLEKQAPHDTMSTQPVTQLPDTTLKEPVFFCLFLSNGITLNVIQQNSGHLPAYKKFMLLQRFKTMVLFLKSAFRFKILDYRPNITIEIPARDAQTIYKAIPAKTRLALRIY
ncbi:MAG: hypothetical protein K9H16_10315 [Bacteroidales bacterium]|nr:hypothetical protein [Bacteroidales bacterium]